MSIRFQLTFGVTSLVLGAALASPASSQVTLQSTLIHSGFTEPLYVTSPPGDTHRLFVVEHRGVIKILRDGTLLATPFLDIDPIVSGGSGSDERGLLGFAFHPDFANNRKCYVSYTDLNGASVLRQYFADASNPDIAETSTFTTILGPIPQPQSNHNGGCIQFQLDGKLFMSLGDGGNANDMGSGHDPNTGNAQSLNTYLGKLLRLDVDNPPTYVPTGNPFGASAFPLIWSYGLRNTWRFSVDRGTGDMYLGDVGQGAVEEVDFIAAASTGAENFGWRCMEGNNCTGFTGCTCNSPALTQPIQQYTHGLGCTVVGGYMYRGSAIPNFQGNYIYADYCSGKIWSFAYNGSTVSNFVDRTQQLGSGSGHSITSPTSFGEDANGEIYICDFGGGEVFRIDALCPPPTTYCTSTPNSTGGASTMGFSGSGSVANNNLHLYAFGNPQHVNGLFYYGQGTAQAPAYNGFRCIANSFHRLPIVQTDSFGDADYQFDVNAPPGVITPGTTWNFQFFYRDPTMGAGANYSDALSVPFCVH